MTSERLLSPQHLWSSLVLDFIASIALDSQEQKGRFEPRNDRSISTSVWSVLALLVESANSRERDTWGFVDQIYVITGDWATYRIPELKKQLESVAQNNNNVPQYVHKNSNHPPTITVAQLNQHQGHQI